MTAPVSEAAFVANQVEAHDARDSSPEELEQGVIDWAAEVGADNLYALSTVAFLLDESARLESGPQYAITLLSVLKQFRKAKMSRADIDAIHQLAIAQDNAEKGFIQ